MRGNMKFYYANKQGETFNISFPNADYDTAPEDIRAAGQIIGASVLSGSSGEYDPLRFIQATGTIETVLASNA